ncbi:IspD/TarI family cytidylyltransferase [Phocaeicola sartorii]|jgi:2-C-methyl-D-erythritol 4-phosphate cytidylyltransferase|uniref:IspD/TarI family cytidylyltransferase n=1 Tax=Phocaeicola sartorii TaxID=671267 RepID=UPI000468CB2D|nr:2-C-methyl-D-erythritol 4-phosphate cytidylyltransferase [Phocaeicola sartorii]
MEKLKDVYAIILAAGKGTRFHGQKQFLEFHDKPLWKHLYDNVTDVVPRENIIVVGVDIEGGKTRSGSVKKGLEWIDARGNCRRVIIMEAARTLVTRKQIEDIAMNDAPSCCYVIPVVDTVILKDKTYLTRSECLSLVSPQAFDFQLLWKAYVNADLSEMRTDETRLMNDVYGIKPTFIEGADNLYKVTYPKDIAVIEELYKHMDEY